MLIYVILADIYYYVITVIRNDVMHDPWYQKEKYNVSNCLFFLVHLFLWKFCGFPSSSCRCCTAASS